MASIESVRASIDANIKTNGRQEITGVVMNAVLNNMVDLSEKNEGTLEEQKTLLNEQSRQIDSLEQKKANEDGKYPELTAGFANNLVGRGEAVDATINFRPSGGTSIEDGAARVKELKGNSVVWNQIIDHIANTETYKGITYTKGQGYYTIVGSVESGSAQSYLFISSPFRQMKGHKYFIFNDSQNENVKVGGYAEGGLPILSAPTIVEATTDTTSQKIAIEVRGSGINETIHPYVVDLTQMFGAGNEPTSVEEFYNRIPQNVDLYAYNEGEIVSTNAEGIKSVGFNAWDEEWENGYYEVAEGNAVTDANYVRSKNAIRILGETRYAFTLATTHGIQNDIATALFYDENNAYISFQSFYANLGFSQEFTTPQNAKYMRFYLTDYYGKTYENDVCINLAHSGYRNGEYQPYMQFIRDIDPRIREAFPNGMRSAGTASDKVYNKNGKGIIEKRIGVVDMGTLDWRSAGNGEFLAEVQDYGLAYTATNLLCKFYQPTALLGVDKTIRYNDSYFGNYVLGVYDSAYTDAATFKAAMSGVMLYYELAEPIITEYDEPFNLDYEVWDFGTEQMLSSEPSAPIKASIVYGFNAVDSVRTAQIEIAELKTQIAQMQAIMASMTAQPAMIDMPTYNI